MKTLRYIIFLQLWLCTVVLQAQQPEGKIWLSYIDDSRLVSSLSIPGAHDAATGEGFFLSCGIGKTQSMGLASLWDCGVRAFDLRPAYCNDELGIYHGPMKTRVTLRDALDILIAKIDENPGEFAIVLMREENEAENDSGRMLWPAALGEAIEALKERAAVFAPDITVGDMRGKILFMSRNAYTGTAKGALVTGWTHSVTGCDNARIESYAGCGTAQLHVQDFYAPVDKAKRHAKREAVLRFLDLAGSAPNSAWTINFLSGYSSRLLGVIPIATTTGYKRNASVLHPVVIDYLEGNAAGSVAPLGIVFMDFAGADKVGGSITHWKKFVTHGNHLVRLLIERNFK